jgi:hypothetical protein
MALEQTLRVTAVVKAVQEPATVIILFHLVAVVPADTQATVVMVVVAKVIPVMGPAVHMLDSCQLLGQVPALVVVMNDRAVVLAY